MLGPSFHVPPIEARALFGREHRAHFLASGVHDRAKRPAWSLPEAVDLHTTASEDAVDAETLQRIHSELFPEVTIALGPERCARAPHRHRAHTVAAEAEGPRPRDHPRGEYHEQQQANRQPAAPHCRSIAHGLTGWRESASRARARSFALGGRSVASSVDAGSRSTTSANDDVAVIASASLVAASPIAPMSSTAAAATPIGRDQR